LVPRKAPVVVLVSVLVRADSSVSGESSESRLGLKRLFLHPFYTVGYGSKDHYDMPYYAVVAAAYGGGLPVRLANDRFEQFQTSIKRH
jgi:hypothetical protein